MRSFDKCTPLHIEYQGIYSERKLTISGYLSEQNYYIIYVPNYLININQIHFMKVFTWLKIYNRSHSPNVLEVNQF